MALFNIPLSDTHDELVSPVVSTPLGMIVFDAIIDGQNLFAMNPSVYSVGQDAYVFRWQLKKFEAEFVFFRPEIAPQLDGRVEDSWAGIWRVKAYQDLDSSCYSCKWQAGYT